TALSELCRTLAVVDLGALGALHSLGLTMITLLGLRQQQLLTLLLENKEGLTVEELSKGLGITDNAVRQHLTALERDGMVVKGEMQSTGGRPEQLFGLTAAGRELFPRHYSWFAELLISSLLEEQGTE